MNTIAVFGAAGHIGAATVRRLGEAGTPVRAVVRRTPTDTRIEGAASVVQADLFASPAVAAAVEGCASAQVIAPLSPLSPDPGAVMGTLAESLIGGLRAFPSLPVLVISDYGAQTPSGTGIPALFHELEGRLAELPNPLTFVRSAEHMHNWARQLPAALRTGTLASPHQPLTRPLPMVHAADVGAITADLLLAPQPHGGSPRVVHVEGPRRYTAQEVAAALAAATGSDISACELPQEDWESTLTAAGATPAFARLNADFFTAHNTGLVDTPAGADVRRGSTSLGEALASAITASAAGR
ncbi:NmrA family NAD(P)-binding protein [Streptomyces sp. NPDC088387]|uniref:NmrA family NAD(P)-binding protein n=1 Tax=Streptomyces sp. NPDC088387 TaxID=3365859 RepID=UPI003808D61B